MRSSAYLKYPNTSHLTLLHHVIQFFSYKIHYFFTSNSLSPTTHNQSLSLSHSYPLLSISKVIAVLPSSFALLPHNRLTPVCWPLLFILHLNNFHCFGFLPIFKVLKLETVFSKEYRTFPLIHLWWKKLFIFPGYMGSLKAWGNQSH